MTTQTMGVYLTQYSNLKSADLNAMDSGKLLNGVQLCNSPYVPKEWVHVGDAEVKVTLFPRAGVVTNQIKSLRVEQATIRANAEAAATRLEQQIQSLLAIGNEVEAS